jgi:hypothetical protein
MIFPPQHRRGYRFSTTLAAAAATRWASEGTLCRDSMPERGRAWLRVHRPKAARHWNLLTALTAKQLRNVEAHGSHSGRLTNGL